MVDLGGLTKEKVVADDDLKTEFTKQVIQAVQLIEDPEVLARLEDVAHRKRFIPQSEETDEQIEDRIRERFEVIDMMTIGAVTGDIKAFVASGPGGTGKSWTVESCLLRMYDGIDQTDAPYGQAYRIEKGYSRATDLYRSLWHTRFKGCTLVLDEADTLWYDPIALPLLKAVLDTTRWRTAKWGSEWKGYDDDDLPIPRRFEYEGSIIFLTNTDLFSLAARNNRMSPHLEALLSRTHYIDTTMRNRRDYIVRMKQAIKDGMLSELEDQQRQDVVDFIIQHQDRLREVSLRMAIKIADLRKLNEKRWRSACEAMCLKG